MRTIHETRKVFVNISHTIQRLLGPDHALTVNTVIPIYSRHILTKLRILTHHELQDIRVYFAGHLIPIRFSLRAVNINPVCLILQYVFAAWQLRDFQHIIGKTKGCCCGADHRAGLQHLSVMSVKQHILPIDADFISQPGRAIQRIDAQGFRVAANVRNHRHILIVICLRPEAVRVLGSKILQQSILHILQSGRGIQIQAAGNILNILGNQELAAVLIRCVDHRTTIDRNSSVILLKTIVTVT